jgi:hypothetical protein
MLAPKSSNSSAVRDDQNQLEQIFTRYSDWLSGAPGAARLASLAKSSRFIDHGLLAHLAELIERLDDVQLTGDDIAIHLIEVGYCGARCASATAFASALAARLQRYIDNPIAASDARGDLRERIAWWSMAVSRAAKLSKWPALVLMQNNNMDMEYSDGS